MFYNIILWNFKKISLKKYAWLFCLGQLPLMWHRLDLHGDTCGLSWGNFVNKIRFLLHILHIWHIAHFVQVISWFGCHAQRVQGGAQAGACLKTLACWERLMSMVLSSPDAAQEVKIIQQIICKIWKFICRICTVICRICRIICK
jgi:hypothetical protein